MKVSLTGAELTLAGIGTITMGGDLVSGAGGVAGVLTLTLDGPTSAPLPWPVTSGWPSTPAPRPSQVGGDRLPAGPYFRIEGDGLVLMFGDALNLTAFAVEQATSATGAARTLMAASGVSLDIGGSELLTDVKGLLVMLPVSGVSPVGLAPRRPAR